jgi:hypothetical protein
MQEDASHSTEPAHPPLSESLQRFVEYDVAHDELTLNHLLDQTEGRGAYVLIILLNLPFLVPISVPGFSILFGAVTVVLAVRMALRLPPHLPRFIGEHKFHSDAMKKVLLGSVKLLRLLEKLVRPRETQWLSWRAACIGNSLLIALMGFMLILPIPPIVPLTNTFPAYAIVVLAASMMEEDGVAIWIGYALALLAVGYFVFIGETIVHVFTQLFHRMLHTGG